MSSLKLKLGLSNGLIIGKLGFPGASDLIAPTITITCAQTSPTATTPLNFTFTLSEPSTDFAIGDITVGNGVASNFAGSGASYTCDIAPTAGGAVTVDVAANAFHDSAGNGNVAATQFSITYAPTYATVFNGTSTDITAGNHATIQNLADNAMTAEGWFLCDTGAGAGARAFFSKGLLPANGWGLSYTNASLTAAVNCVTTSAQSVYSNNFQDGTWHHIAMTWDDAGDRKIDIFVDGVEVSYALQIAGVDAIKADTSYNLTIGYGGFSQYFHKGKIGWVRLSNVVRYTTSFTPPARATPPASDANTVRIYKMDEGTGTNINDTSSNAIDATMTNGSWVEAP